MFFDVCQYQKNKLKENYYFQSIQKTRKENLFDLIRMEKDKAG